MEFKDFKRSFPCPRRFCTHKRTNEKAFFFPKKLFSLVIFLQSGSSCDNDELASFHALAASTPLSRSQSLAEALARAGSLSLLHRVNSTHTPASSSGTASPRSPFTAGDVTHGGPFSHTLLGRVSTSDDVAQHAAPEAPLPQSPRPKLHHSRVLGHRSSDNHLLARRTRSAAPSMATRMTPHSEGRLQQQRRIDFLAMSAFVPDLDQPAVAAAYHIAATPDPKRRVMRRLPGPGYDNGVLEGGRDSLKKIGQLSPCLKRNHKNKVYGAVDPVEEECRGEGDACGDGGWTIDVGSLAKALQAMKQANPELLRLGESELFTSDHAASADSEAPIPRRFTDGGALLSPTLGLSAPWRSSTGDLHPELEQHTTQNYAQVKVLHSAQQPLKSPTLIAPTAHPAKIEQLQKFETALLQEVTSAEGRAQAAEAAARAVEDTIQALQSHLKQIQTEVDHKMDVLHVLLSRVAEADRELAEVERKRALVAPRVDAVLALRAQLQKDAAEKAVVVRALMRAVSQMSSSPPTSPAKSPRRTGGGRRRWF